MGRKITKKIGKITLIVVGAFLALDLLVVGLLFVPPIQEKVVKLVAETLSDKWNSKITIGHIYLSPTLKLTVEDLIIHDAHNNPMIAAGKLQSRLKSFGTNPVELNFFATNTENIRVVVRKYEGENAVNIAIWAKNFQKKKKKKNPFELSFSSLTLHNAYFVYVNDEVRRQQQNGLIDYGYFELKDIETQLDNFKLVGSNINADIKKLALTQYTGFQLLNLSGKFHIGPTGLSINNATIATPNSRMFMNFAFNYDSWKDYSDFLNKVKFDVVAKSSTVNMSDIHYFAPQVAGMNNKLVFSANVTGPVNNLSISDFDARFADNTHLCGDVTLKNVTDFFNAEITAQLSQSEVDLNELQDFKLPGGKVITLPKEFQKIGTATVDVDYAGVVSEAFKVSANLSTSIGNVAAQLVTDCLENESVDYQVNVETQSLALNSLLPSLNMLGRVTGSVDAKGNVGKLDDLVNTLTTQLSAKIASISVKGYPLHNLALNGSLNGKEIQADVNVNDANCHLAFSGSMDFASPDIHYSAEASIANFSPSKMFAHLPEIPANSSGFDKIVRYVQQHPDVELSVGNLSCDLSGQSLNTLFGNIFMDSLAYAQDYKQLEMNRLRLVSLSNDEQRKIILNSDYANAYVSTTYDLAEVPQVLLDMVYTYCGNLLPNREQKTLSSNENDFLELKISDSKVSDLLAIFVPSVTVADNTTLKVYTNGCHHNDQIQLYSPLIEVGNSVKINNLKVDATQKDTLELALKANLRDLAIGEKGNFSFNTIELSSQLSQQEVTCRLDWVNPDVISARPSFLGANVKFEEDGTIQARITESEIYFKEFPFHFNENHSITIAHGDVELNQIILTSPVSSINVDGHVGKNGNNLSARINNLNIELANHFIKTDKMRINGNLSANVNVRDRNDRLLLTGTALVKDFIFNDEELGYLYANAILPSDKNIHFRGGLIRAEDFPADATVDNYNYRENFTKQKGVNTKLNGLYDSEAHRLKVTADIDTLPLGFLENMLSSFSHKFSGNASGLVDFVMTKDSIYFEGKANVREAEIGIAPLNTCYYLENQSIDFTKDGFSFNNVDLTDKFGNHATMNGYVNHQKFSSFDLNLKISTKKIFVLNTKQEQDSPFYGDGFVSGNIAIVGDTKKLSFSGNDLATQAGTIFCLPISFADKAYASDVINFKVAHSDSLDDDEPETPPSDMEMDFDFIFNVTPAADIKLDLDLSAFGGKIKTKGEGQLHFTYNTKVDKINILGDVVLQSGSFIMSFASLVNKKFELQPGGVVNFPGSLYDINMSVDAKYSTTASLADLFTSEVTNIRRMRVDSYLRFNGNLNDPASIDFAFELPNATQDFKTLFYSALDTTNIQKRTEQFFSLVLLGKFASDQISDNDISIENTGIGLLTSTLSNFISNQLKVVDISLNYQNATANKAAEYTVGASTSLFNDRTVIQTYLGYKDDNSVSTSEQFIGDFSVEQKLNELGTWRLKVFNVTNQDELRNSSRNSPYAQGVAVIYKQDFNNRKDLIASFKRSSKKEKKSKRKNKNGNVAVLPDEKNLQLNK